MIVPASMWAAAFVSLLLTIGLATNAEAQEWNSGQRLERSRAVQLYGEINRSRNIAKDIEAELRDIGRTAQWFRKEAARLGTSTDEFARDRTRYYSSMAERLDEEYERQSERLKFYQRKLSEFEAEYTPLIEKYPDIKNFFESVVEPHDRERPGT